MDQSFDQLAELALDLRELPLFIKHIILLLVAGIYWRLAHPVFQYLFLFSTTTPTIRNGWPVMSRTG